MFLSILLDVSRWQASELGRGGGRGLVGKLRGARVRVVGEWAKVRIRGKEEEEKGETRGKGYS